MKKVFIAILTIALLLSACGNRKSVESIPTETTPAETAPTYPGTWKLDHVLMGNSEVSQAELEAASNEIANTQLILKDGGKAYMVIGPQKGFLDWSETSSGIQLASYALIYENGYLALNIDDNNVLLFQKVSDSQLIENVDESTADIPETSTPDESLSEETEVAPSTDATTPESTESLVDGMRPAFKEAMDAYEAFYNEYCDFLSKYAQNPTDFSLLGQYAGMLSKAGEMDEAFKEWKEDDMNSAELQYYLEVNSRVLQKLAGVMNK